MPATFPVGSEAGRPTAAERDGRRRRGQERRRSLIDAVLAVIAAEVAGLLWQRKAVIAAEAMRGLPTDGTLDPAAPPPR